MSWLVSGITKAVLKLIWTIVIQGPLALINVFDTVFHYLTSGVMFDVLFGGKTFSLNKIPAAFWAFCVVALLICFIIFFVQYMTLLFIDELTIKERFVKSIKSSLLGIIFTIFIPIGFFLMCTFIDFLQKAIGVVFASDENAFAKMLYKLGDPTWDGSTISDVPSSFSAPDNISDYNLLSEIAGVWFMLYTIAMVGMTIGQKIFELYCLFIIGPFFAATMPNDNGVRMKQWRDTSMGKMLVCIGTLLVYDSFIVICAAVIKTALPHFEGQTTARMLLILLIILGGGVYCQVMPAFFANFVNESAGAAEGKNALRSTMAAGGMFKSAGVGLALAAGVGKTAQEKAIKKHGAVGGSVGGGSGAAPNAQTAGSDSEETKQSGGYGAKRRVGLAGLFGAGIRATTNIVGAAITGGALVGAVVGTKASRGRAKARLHASGERMKAGVKDKFNNFKDATVGNTAAHSKSKDHFEGDKEKRFNSYKDKQNAKINKVAEKYDSKFAKAKTEAERDKIQAKVDKKTSKHQHNIQHINSAIEKSGSNTNTSNSTSNAGNSKDRDNN